MFVCVRVNVLLGQTKINYEHRLVFLHARPAKNTYKRLLITHFPAIIDHWSTQPKMIPPKMLICLICMHQVHPHNCRAEPLAWAEVITLPNLALTFS